MNALLWCALVPIIIVMTTYFYKNKGNALMINRDPSFVLSLNALILIDFSIERPMKVCNKWNLASIPTWFMSTLTVSIVYGVLYLICIKSYLLFFRQRYHDSIQNKTWIQSIDSSWNDWYIHNYRKWGQFSYMIRWTAIPWIIVTMEPILGHFFWNNFSIFRVIFQVIAALTPFCLLLIFVFRLRHFYDIYGIRKEIIMQCTVSLCIIFIYMISWVIWRVVLDDQSFEYANYMTVNVLIFVLFGFFGISSVYYPLYRLKLYEKTEETSKHTTTISTMKRSFADLRIFSLFMRHLVSEFATENLLFIIELLQIKYAYQLSKQHVIKVKNHNNKFLVIDFNVNDSVNSVIYIFGATFTNHMVQIEFHSDVPTSNLLKLHENDIYGQIRALYVKYIETGAECELNVSYEMRNTIIQKVKSLNSENTKYELMEGDLYWLFDECCLHIFQLLQDPFGRFCSSKPYKEYVNSAEYQTKTQMFQMKGSIDMTASDAPKIYDAGDYDELNDSRNVTQSK